MVRTRSQLEYLSKDELIDELMSIEDTYSKLVNLTTRFDDFTRRFEILSSELAVSKNCNWLLSEWIIQLERNAVKNTQYHQHKSIEINPVPASISNEELEDNVCKALSLIGHEVIPDDLQACHRLKKKEIVIVKFKSRKQKQNILIDRKNLCNKSENLTQLKFAGKFFISESMCHENHKLAYKCRQLENAGKIHSTWFWNNVINVKLDERSQAVKIYNIIDIKKLGVDNLDEFVNNTSF